MATSLGVRGATKHERCKYTYSKRVINELLTI